MKNLLVITYLLIFTMGCITGSANKRTTANDSNGRKRFSRKESAGGSSVISQSTPTVAKGEVPALIATVRDVPEPVKEEPKKVKPVKKEKKQKAIVTKKKKNTSIKPQERVSKVYILKPNDNVSIFLRGIPKEERIDDMIDENGYISLPYIDQILAAGRTSSELEKVVRKAYLSGKIYRNVTVNVMIPSLNYFIRGEVKGPGRQPLVAGVTVLQAVAAAGGYTEYANAKKIQIVRGDQVFYVNARDFELHPERDLELEAGDVIVVSRSMW